MAFYDAHPEATVSEVFNMEMEPVEEPEVPTEPVRTIEMAKIEMVQKIYDYDASENAMLHGAMTTRNLIMQHWKISALLKKLMLSISPPDILRS